MHAVAGLFFFFLPCSIGREKKGLYSSDTPQMAFSMLLLPPDNPTSDGRATFSHICFFVTSPPPAEGKQACVQQRLDVTVSFSTPLAVRNVFWRQLIPTESNTFLCLTSHNLQNIPLVSCCLHLWSSLDFVNISFFGLFIAPYHASLTETDARKKRCKYKLFLKKTKHTYCYTTCHY